MKEQSYVSTPPLGPCGPLQGETLPTLHALSTTIVYMDLDIKFKNTVL